MSFSKIMCCCGSGLGSSLIVHMNTEDIVKKLGHSEIQVDHTTISDINLAAKDTLFIVGNDLKDFIAQIPDEDKIILTNIIDKNELEQKLSEKLA